MFNSTSEKVEQVIQDIPCVTDAVDFYLIHGKLNY